MKKKVAIFLTMILLITMSMPISVYAANKADAEAQASALKLLGLFKGVSDDNFDLDRTPTRTEALIMLIRVLGQEPEALNGSRTHPFTDVASWADKYVGYAYEKGLIKGISDTEFGSGNANSDMYLTFMLRALGYSDLAGDFVWNEPDTLAKTVGILSDKVDTANFLRADAVIVSWAALEASLKVESDTGAKTLSENLMSAGVLKSEDYRAAKQLVNGNESTASSNKELSVSTVDELKAALENKETTVVNISSDIEITDKLFFERDIDLMLNIEKGKTLTISGEFIPVGFSVTNNGSVVISGIFDRGLSSFINNGSLTVKSGGTFSSGVSNTDNCGTIMIDIGGKLLIERGTGFNNLGTLTNNGYISVNDGGSLNNEKGTITNNGTIDLYTYFTGNIKDILGTGKINDNR